MSKNGNENVENVVEGEATEVPVEETKGKTDKISEAANKTLNEASKAVNDAFKQVESIGKALGSALQDRANVVMVRVNDDSLRYLDMLVEADMTKSRSESAAFLINEGIRANEELFNKIRNITDQIADLKTQLRDVVNLDEE